MIGMPQRVCGVTGMPASALNDRVDEERGEEAHESPQHRLEREHARGNAMLRIKRPPFVTDFAP